MSADADVQLAAARAEMVRVGARLAGRAGVVAATTAAATKLDTFETVLIGPLAIPRTLRAFYETFDHVEGVVAPLSAIARALKAQWRAGEPLRAPIAPGRALVLPDGGYDGRFEDGEGFLQYLHRAT